MTSVTFDTGPWLDALHGAVRDLELDSEESVTDLGKAIATEMRDSAPTMDAAERARRLNQPHSRVRKVTGRFTIRAVKGRDRQGFYVDVGPSRKAFYLAFIEWGTSKMSARPFLRPAIERAVANWMGR